MYRLQLLAHRVEITDVNIATCTWNCDFIQGFIHGGGGGLGSSPPARVPPRILKTMMS